MTEGVKHGVMIGLSTVDGVAAISIGVGGNITIVTLETADVILNQIGMYLDLVGYFNDEPPIADPENNFH